MNLLFVCSRNQWRSPTAAAIYARHPGIQTRSAGTSPNARHTVTHGDIVWADLIFVMEAKHRSRLRADFPEAIRHKTLVVLDIEDLYRAGDPTLIAEITRAVDPYLAPEDTTS